jgi:hypothetical protein
MFVCVLVAEICTDAICGWRLSGMMIIVGCVHTQATAATSLYRPHAPLLLQATFHVRQQAPHLLHK